MDNGKIKKTTTVIDQNEANPRYLVTPDVAGTQKSSIIINGAAAAGSKHLDDSATAPTLANTLAEQIIWTFDPVYDQVRRAMIMLNIPDLRVFRAAAANETLLHEVVCAKLVVNQDDVSAANLLTVEGDAVDRIWPGIPYYVDVSNTTYADGSPVYISTITIIAKKRDTTGIPTPTLLSGGAEIYCKGMSYA